MRVDEDIYLSRPKDVDELKANKLDEALCGAVRNANRVDILSAYYGTYYITELLKNVLTGKRKHCDVRMVFGVTTPAGLAKATHDLKDFMTTLKGMKFRNIDIRLFTKALFHTKLYYFLKGTAPVWFIGSANASSAIQGDRHELMIRLSGRHDGLLDYVEEVVNASVPVGMNPRLPGGPARDMRSFFLRGSLCYRPTARSIFTFEACKITAEHRTTLKRAMANAPKVAHADWRPEGFGFNLISAVEGRNPGASPEKKVAEQSILTSEKDGGVTKLTFRHLAVETTLGYWLPAPYAQLIKTNLCDGDQQRSDHLAKFAEALGSLKEEELHRELDRHIADLRAIFETNHQNIAPKDNVEKSFCKFLSTRKAMLTDPETRNRMARRLVLTSVPDLWGDLAAADEFELSFCADIAFRLGKPGSRSHIVAVLRGAIDGLESDVTPKEFHCLLTRHLEDTGWDEEDWRMPRGGNMWQT